MAASNRRNPLSPCAMTVEEVREGVKFLWYTPGDDNSLKWGTFTSDPYIEDDEHFVVDCLVGDPDSREVTLELADMGIVNSRFDTEQWAGCMTKAR